MDPVIFDLFWVFFRIGFLSFGGVIGVLPELERMVVAEHGWVTSERFVQAYVIGQFLPGPNMAMCPLLGYWVAGIPGFMAGFLGIYTPPVLMMGVAYRAYRVGRQHEVVRRAERALRPLVLGLMLAAVARLWWVQLGGEAPGVQALSLLVVGLAGLAYGRGKLGALTVIFAAGLVWYAVALGRQWI